MTAAARILVVDDDAGARLLMRAALRKSEFEISLAVDGEDALRQFQPDSFDIVVLDVDMPGVDGYVVCAQMRAQAGTRLPILMVTGMDDVQSVERAYESGATDFISKPINWALIGYRVKYLLRGYAALRELKEAESRTAAILAAIPDLLFEIDIDGRYIECHAPHSEFLVAPVQDLIGKTMNESFPPPVAAICMEALQAAHERGFSTGRQFPLTLPEGDFWFELSVSRKDAAAGQKPTFIVLSRDITERKVAEARIARLAYFDSLTGLPNRRSFLERVNRETQRARRSTTQFAVLFMDLDGFKNVNDTLGHTVGDLMLQWSAQRLREGLRPYDALARPSQMGADPFEAEPAGQNVELARLGGDEFIALISGIERPEDALVVAHRVGQLMRQPFMLEGREVNLSISVGIAMFPDDGIDGETLLKHADTAMYHAKASGRDNAQFYSASLTDRAMRRLELDSQLRTALERDEFHLVYQPLLDAASGRVHGVEALIRWQPPGRPVVPPIEFIPLTEENGLIRQIGAWVLRTACADAVNWSSGAYPIDVAVNLSPMQFRDPDLLESIKTVLAQTGLAPERLVLEMTEGALMEDSAVTLAMLRGLRALGVRIALDDFGTGYSSLSYLTRMPISNIKIDQSFISGGRDSGENDAIVRAVIAMAATLGMQVTAEGVETIAQAQKLKAMACDTLQGYYFGRPVRAQLIPDLLARHWVIGDGENA